MEEKEFIESEQETPLEYHKNMELQQRGMLVHMLRNKEEYSISEIMQKIHNLRNRAFMHGYTKAVQDEDFQEYNTWLN